MSMLSWVVHTHRRAYEHGLGKPHPDEQGKPEDPTALCSSYRSIRTWRITRARTGLSLPAGYLYKLWDRVAFNCGYQPRHHACASLYGSLNQGFTQSHSQRTNLRSLHTKWQEYGLGADEAAASAIPRESQEQRGRDHSLNLLAHSWTKGFYFIIKVFFNL